MAVAKKEVVGSADIADDGPAQGHSALKSLLERSVIYEKAGAVIPHDLLQFGLFGSGLIVAAGLLALILPSAYSIQHGGFFLLLGSTTASLDSFMGSLAAPAFIVGGGLLVLDACLMLVRTSQSWRAAIVLQAALGGSGGLVCAAFLALVAFNLALWILIVTAALMVIGMILGAMGS
jgi:hypothetical protein